MLQILNRTPLLAGLALFSNSDGQDLVSIAVKGTFRLPPPSGSPTLSKQQVPLHHADAPPAEDDGLCQYTADLVMGKLTTDVGLSGSAYSPRGAAVDAIPVEMTVGCLLKRAVVRSTEAAARLPARCFLFMSAADTRRRRYGGTYDERWQREHCPLPPKDFDLRFFNAADPDLIATDYLRGDEWVTLLNLSQHGPLRFRLPALAIWLRAWHRGELIARQADLWNVHFEPDEDRFCLSWGCVFPTDKRPSAFREVEVRAAGEVASLTPE